jgi:hypothetical protein
MVAVCFCALSSKIGDQEPIPCQTSGWIYLKGMARGFQFAAMKACCHLVDAGGVLSEIAGVRAWREGLILRLKLYLS